MERPRFSVPPTHNEIQSAQMLIDSLSDVDRLDWAEDLDDFATDLVESGYPSSAVGIKGLAELLRQTEK